MKPLSIVSHRITTTIVVIVSIALAVFAVRIFHNYILLSLIMAVMFVAIGLDVVYSHLMLEKIMKDYESLKDEMAQPSQQ